MFRNGIASWKGVLAAALSLGLALGALSHSAAAADEAASHSEVPEPRLETVVTSAGVVQYRFQPQDYSRYDAMVIHEVKGVPTVQGCSFHHVMEADASKGTVSLEVTELFYDPEACLSTLAVFTAHDPGDSVVDAAPSAVTTWGGWFEVRLKDPIDITVNSVRTHRTQTSAGGYSGYGVTSHYTPTGWSRTSFGNSNYSTYSTTSATFKNTIFCNPVVATYANYSSVRLNTTTSGGYSTTASYTKSGDCASLLAFSSSSLYGRTVG